MASYEMFAMANPHSSADSVLSAQTDALSDEPPRKRRAAAVAAQKNWQMLNKPDDEFDINGDDIIITNPKDVMVDKSGKVTILSHPSLNSSAKKSNSYQTPQTIVIDMAPNRVRRRSDLLDSNDYDYDYEPHNNMSAKQTKTKSKSLLNTKKMSAYVISNVPNNSNAIKSNIEIICIDGEETRVRPVNTNSYRKPPIVKIHANEPEIKDIVDGEVEEIVGTYSVDDYKCLESDEQTDYLDLRVSNECSDAKQTEKVENDVQKSAEITVTPIVPSIQTISSKPLIISFSRKEKLINHKISTNQVIGSLEMVCENVDDEFADNTWIECDDDILDEQQWSASVTNKKQYDSYVNAVKSAKTCTFLPEDEVKEPLGTVTEIVSVTTRAVTSTTQLPLRNYTRNQVNSNYSRQPVNTSQSFIRPISSTINRVNLLHPQRQRMINPMINNMPLTNQLLNPQLTASLNTSINPTLNGSIILPVASSGISTPLILAPQRNHQQNVNMTAIPPGVQVILSQGPQNQTFIMYPKSTNNATLPTNTIIQSSNRPVNNASTITLPSNLYLQNDTPLLRQNLLQTTSSNAMATPTLAQQLRAPPSNAPTLPPASQFIRVVYNNVASRQPLVTAVNRIRAPFSQFTTQNTYSAINNQNNSNIIQSAVASNNQTLLRNVVLNTENSKKIDATINNKNDPLFDCLAIIKGNPIKKINMRTLLTIKPLPFTWPSSIDALISSLIKLDNALMKEKFKESPIAWMVNAQLITPPKCKVCNRGLCNQVNRSKDGRNEYWMCNNQRCNSTVNIERPLVFAAQQFDIPVSKLLFIVYYWSIQVDVEDLIKTGQIEMGTDVIYNIWQKLQRVCSTALHNKDPKLGALNKAVDVASVQIGRFYIVGAMESGTHRCKLAVISIGNVVQLNGKDYFLQPIVRWVEKGSIIRTCEVKFASLRDFGFRVTVLSKSEFLCTGGNLSLANIGGYMIHHLQRFFKDMDVTALTYDILSNVLEELLWRERFGTNPYSAFTNIIKHIAEQCGLRRSDHLVTQSANITASRMNVATNRVIASRATTTQPAVAAADPNSVFVDEYYYSYLELKSAFAKKNLQNEESSKDSIQCHLCQMFFDNVLIIKHLLEHLEKERRGRVRKGDNNESECKHCLRFFSTRSMHMHDELTNMKIIPFACRICALPFYARNPFIHHMKTSHFSGEMPYYCDICSYRSSFQKHLFDHFETAHTEVEAVMCPYCVKIFQLTKHKNLSAFIYRHLTTHYAVASVYDCDKCVLTFVAKSDLREHCFKGHNPSNAIDEKFDLISYEVRQEDSSLCVRAQENELFTPNLPTFLNNSDTPGFADNDIEAIDNNGNDVDADSVVVNCEPFMDDYLIEPEIQISLTDNDSQIENFILPVDSDYSNEQFKDMLIKSFDFCEEMPDIIVHSDRRLNCIECDSYLNAEHFMKKGMCVKCKYTTHCKKAYTEHMIDVHNSSSKKTKYISASVLCNSPLVQCYDLVCEECKFATNDGNDMASHMVTTNHFITFCKSLI